MRVPKCVLIALLFVTFASIFAQDTTSRTSNNSAVADDSGFSFRDSANQLEIHFGEQRIATYLKRHDKLTRRGLVNVMTPSGIQVTRQFPAPPSSDHTVMHPGIWMGYGDLNGNDYWRLQAEVKFDGFTEAPNGEGDSGSFTARNLYLTEEDAKVVCVEITRHRFYRVPQGLLLTIEATYQSDQHDFYFGDQEESGLAVRVSAPIRVDTGNGTILTDSGDRNGSEVRGKFAKWFDYFGVIDNHNVGLMVASHPQNPKTTWLHARDYGLVATNPFPMQPKERRDPFVKTWVKRGEEFRLAYAILIHDLPADQTLDRAAAYRQMLQALEKQ